MDRKAVAKETLRILGQGYYEYQGRRIEIETEHQKSIRESSLYTPENGERILKQYQDGLNRQANKMPGITVKNCPAVESVLELVKADRKTVGVLNFASAKNPGGGFLNGAMAQEESLAASGGLYETLTAHEEYYRKNREQTSMMYTDHAIYSPDVIFFRNGQFRLLDAPVTASVLTLPAVNMGQVLLKGEDVREAKRIMRRRMALALALFAAHGNKNLILGAYGCGVFRNDPQEVARWWKELLEEGFGIYFDWIVFAVMDRSRNQECIKAFDDEFAVSG